MNQAWLSSKVAVNGINLHVTRTGEDKPPVLLAHGFTGNGANWIDVVQPLAGEYEFIMVDARGHGLSDAPPTGYSSREMAADLAGVIQALGLEKPAVIGHSMGASTAAMAAARHPELVGKLILEDPPLPGPQFDQAERAAVRLEWEEYCLNLKSMTRQEIIAEGRKEHPTWPEHVMGPWAEGITQLNMRIFQYLTSPAPAWQGVMAHIESPILLITGDPDLGGLVTPELAREAAGLWKNGRIAHIPGAGHNIRREQPELYVQVVAEFLRN